MTMSTPPVGLPQHHWHTHVAGGPDAIPGLPPSGAAGGVLAGTYPNPDINATIAGAGLSVAANVLAVNAGTGLEIVADNVRIATTAAGTGLTGGGGVALATDAHASANRAYVASASFTVPADQEHVIDTPLTINSGVNVSIDSGGVLRLGDDPMPWESAWGLIALANLAATSGVITTPEVIVHGIDVGQCTFGRCYRAYVNLRVASTVAADEVTVKLYQQDMTFGSVLRVTETQTVTAANRTETVSFQWDTTGLFSPCRFYLAVLRSAGTGNVTAVASGGETTLAFEDTGPGERFVSTSGGIR